MLEQLTKSRNLTTSMLILSAGLLYNAGLARSLVGYSILRPKLLDQDIVAIANNPRVELKLLTMSISRLCSCLENEFLQLIRGGVGGSRIDYT
jgi:hypothetical protein